MVSLSLLYFLRFVVIFSPCNIKHGHSLFLCLKSYLTVTSYIIVTSELSKKNTCIRQLGCTEMLAAENLAQKCLPRVCLEYS